MARAGESGCDYWHAGQEITERGLGVFGLSVRA